MVPDDVLPAPANVAGALIPIIFTIIVILAIVIYFTMTRDERVKIRDTNEK